MYYVANITHAKEIDDPSIPGKNALLVYVYVAKEDQWKEFEKPALVRELEEREGD
ncbi:hypothetical protein [Spirosoma endophyticum]|uniref:hypothetical protein n=1 Tax=Spirosoma endophyticum TaxID=662367 RepID=UPI0015A63D73|nr:hypothetical protein [Spirosoma endophyticum]